MGDNYNNRRFGIFLNLFKIVEFEEDLKKKKFEPLKRIAFPGIEELKELKGPFEFCKNPDDLIFVREMSEGITPIWYKYDISKKIWLWTPYTPFDLNFAQWFNTNNLVVSSGFYLGSKPATPNINIINYLCQKKPIHFLHQKISFLQDNSKKQKFSDTTITIPK